MNIKKLLTDESGATAIEYALIAALIGIAAVSALVPLGGQVSNTYSSVGSSMADGTSANSVGNGGNTGGSSSSGSTSSGNTSSSSSGSTSSGNTSSSSSSGSTGGTSSGSTGSSSSGGASSGGNSAGGSSGNGADSPTGGKTPIRARDNGVPRRSTR